MPEQQSKSYKWKSTKWLNTLVRSKCCFLYSHWSPSVRFSGTPTCINIERNLCSPRLTYGLISHFHHLIIVNSNVHFANFHSSANFHFFVCFFSLNFYLCFVSVLSIQHTFSWLSMNCFFCFFFWYFVSVYNPSTDIVGVCVRAPDV